MDEEQSPATPARERPAWMDSPAWAVLMLAMAGYWGWYAVEALRAGVLWLAALDALLCLVMLWAGVRILRRRMASDR